MKLIRGSEISDFLRCRKRWNYRWNEHLKPKRPDGKLYFGTLLHKGLEVYYDTKDPGAGEDAILQLFRETDTHNMEQTELAELLNLTCSVYGNYINQWGAVDKNWTIIAQELTFAIPLDDEIAYTGTIDLVFLDEYGNLCFADHKSTSSIEKYEKNLEMDRQVSRYWWALQQLARGNGYVLYKEDWLDIMTWDFNFITDEPTKFIYNIILRDVPTEPELLKKGGLSKAKNQKTTYAKYVQALKDNDLLIEGPYGYQEPEDYREIVQHLLEQETPQGNRFFRRIEVRRTEAEVQAAMQEFLETARDAMESPRIYRNINSECSWDCPYKALCMAEMDNSNSDMIRNLAYETEEVESWQTTLENNPAK